MKTKAILVALPLLVGAGVCVMLLARQSSAPSATRETLNPASLLPANPSPAGFRGPLAPGEVDLMKHLKFPDDEVQGTWTVQGSALLSPAVQWARLAIPCVPPEEYDLRITATRRQGTDSLNIGFVRAGQQGLLMIDGNGGETSWIDLYSPYDLSSNETSVLGKYLKWNQPAKILLSVRKEGVSVTIGAEKIIQWKGEAADLKLIPGYRVPNRKGLFIGSWETVIQIDELVLVPVTGTPQLLH